MNRDNFHFDVFPKDFVWSAATAATQIEGAWNEAGKRDIRQTMAQYTFLVI